MPSRHPLHALHALMHRHVHVMVQLLSGFWRLACQNGETVLTAQDLLNFALELLGIQCEAVVGCVFCHSWVEAVQRPVAGVCGSLGLL